MFLRFRQSARRLQLSLVETRREDSKVRHEHVASLGAIGVPPTVPDRVAFWARLHQHLGRLSNRLDDEMRTKILGAVHARVPIPTIDEQRALQLENATVEDYKGLIATTERTVAKGEAAMAQAADRVTTAEDRIARLEKGEAVPGGLHAGISRKELMAILGWKESDVRHANRLAEIDKIPGAWDELMNEISKHQRRREKAASLVVIKRHFREILERYQPVEKP